MADLQSAGKIRVIGVSNFSPPQIEAFRQVAPVHTVQSPYNLFERAIEDDVLPYCRDRNIVTLAYGPLCRGLASGRMTGQTQFAGDDLRKNDPKFQAPRFAQYLRAVERLDRFAQANYGRRVIHLALRWVLDRQDSTVALWGARRPDQLVPIAGLSGWQIDPSAMVEIDRILSETIVDAVGPEFMAPPDQLAAKIIEIVPPEDSFANANGTIDKEAKTCLQQLSQGLPDSSATQKRLKQLCARLRVWSLRPLRLRPSISPAPSSVGFWSATSACRCSLARYWRSAGERGGGQRVFCGVCKGPARATAAPPRYH